MMWSKELLIHKTFTKQAIASIICCWVGFVVCTLALANTGEYGPAFTETGFHGAGDYYAESAPVVVNHFGGNILLSSTDVSIPSQGQFSLHFTRSYSSEARNIMGPLGLGWVGHYGFLKTRSITTGGNPEFVDATGAREIFYLHNRTELSSIKPPGNPPQTWSWISPTLRVLQLSNSQYKMYEPNGLVYEFTQVNTIWVPTRIVDESGNTWTITYRDNWWANYAEHPLVETLQESGTTRYLTFIYTSGSFPRLDSIRYRNSTMQAQYFYDTVAGNRFLLKEHKTPELRKTAYLYYTDTSQFGALKKITLDTGGVTTINYNYRWMYFPGNNVNVLAVSSIQKGSDTWSYTFPNSQQGDTYTAQVDGPNGYSATYKYHTYANGGCINTDVWKVGFLKESTETYNNTTHKTTWVPGTPLQISNESVWSLCSANLKPMAVRLDKVIEKQDGTDIETRYSDYDVVYPRRITRPGGVNDTLQYQHFVGGNPYYRLGAKKSVETKIGSTLISKRVVASFHGSKPNLVRVYRDASQYWTIDYDYYSTSPKAGAIQRVTQASYTEQYDYNNGVLNTINYPGTTKPDTLRSISTLGRIDSETIDGVITQFTYDSDGRMKSVSRPRDSAITINYTNKKVTLSQDSEKTEYFFDDWGRLEKLLVLVDGVNANTLYGYNELGYRVNETTPQNLQYTMTYDVTGRMRSRTSSQDRYTFSYQTRSDRQSKTVVKNGSLTTTIEQDYLGRITKGITNDKIVDYAYSSASGGVKQTITTNARTRSITLDFLGNTIQETHPEHKNSAINYTYNSRGWLERIDQPEGRITYNYLADGRINYMIRDGYSRGRVDYNYNSTYGKTDEIIYQGISYLLRNFDTQGRPRKIQLQDAGPKRLAAPVTYLSN